MLWLPSVMLSVNGASSADHFLVHHPSLLVVAGMLNSVMCCFFGNGYPATIATWRAFSLRSMCRVVCWPGIAAYLSTFKISSSAPAPLNKLFNCAGLDRTLFSELDFCA